MRSALTCLEAPLRLVDHVHAALAAHDTIVAVATAQRFQRIADFHGLASVAFGRIWSSGRPNASRGPDPSAHQKRRAIGIELARP
jgi:hypothetical protein